MANDFASFPVNPTSTISPACARLVAADKRLLISCGPPSAPSDAAPCLSNLLRYENMASSKWMAVFKCSIASTVPPVPAPVTSCAAILVSFSLYPVMALTTRLYSSSGSIAIRSKSALCSALTFTFSATHPIPAITLRSRVHAARPWPRR